MRWFVLITLFALLPACSDSDKSDDSGEPDDGTSGAPTVRWLFETPAAVTTPPALDSNGNIYFVVGSEVLYGVNPDGSLRWTFLPGLTGLEGPAIGPDGTLYLSAKVPHPNAMAVLHILAVTAEGELSWEYTTPEIRADSDCSPQATLPPAISADDLIYTGIAGFDGATILVLNSDGSLRFEFDSGITSFSPKLNSITLSGDGNIHVAWTSCTDDASSLKTFSGDGTFLFGSPGYAGPAIDTDGVLYSGKVENPLQPDVCCFGPSLYAIQPDGTITWSLSTEGRIWKSPSIGPDGAIYMGSDDPPDPALEPDCCYGALYAANPDGTIRWTIPTESDWRTTPTIGADGTIYAVDGKLRVINPDGTIRWTSETTYSSGIFPALAPDGTLYLARSSGLEALQTTSLGLAESPWPKYAGGSRNAFSAGTP